jgi:hypothetical protein
MENGELGIENVSREGTKTRRHEDTKDESN